MPARFRAAGLLCAALVLLGLAGCRMGAKGVPVKPDLEGVSIVVWDADQPAMPGVPSYRAEAARVVRDFCARYQVTVDLKFVVRQEISDFLSGRASGDGPAVAFSSEWPFLPDKARDVSSYVGDGAYLDAALDYWREDGRILAIPSYVHWMCVASRARGTGEDVPPAAVPAKVAYLSDSPGFLRSTLDLPGAGWDAGKIAAFLSYLKDEYGPSDVDPLGAWSDGVVQALYPATPFLLRWMKGTSGEVVPLPLKSPFDDPRFYYTIPGYLVLATDGLQRECAMLLGKELAANLGRWAARAVGGIPALSNDVVIFNVESSLGHDARCALLSSLGGYRFHAPAMQDFLLRESLERTLSPVIADYLSGKAAGGDLSASIQDILQRHTKP